MTKGAESQPAQITRVQARMSVLVVLIGFVATFLSRGVADSYIIFLVALEAEFGWSRASLTGVYSTYMIASGLSAPIWGYLFDRFGPRLTYGGGFLILGLNLLLASQTTALWHIYMTAGVLAGVCVSALGIVPASNLISRWFGRRRGTAMAIAHAGFGVSLLVMLPLVQLLIDTTSWRQTYFLLGGVLLCVFPLAFVLPWPRLLAGSGQFAVLSAGVAAQPGLAALSDQGMTLRAALRTREFWLLGQIYIFTAAGMFGVIVQTVPFLIDHGQTALNAASIFGATAFLGVLGVLLAGTIADIYGNRLTATVSFTGTAMGTLALFIYSYMPHPVVIWMYVLLFGLSQGARGPIISTLTTRIFAGRGLSAIHGAVYLLMSVGAATGSLTAGVLHDLTGSYRTGFLVSVVFIGLAALPFWVSDRLMRLDPE